MIKYHFFYSNICKVYKILFHTAARQITYFKTKTSTKGRFLPGKRLSTLHKIKQFVQNYGMYFNGNTKSNITLISNNEAYGVKKVSFT